MNTKIGHQKSSKRILRNYFKTAINSINIKGISTLGKKEKNAIAAIVTKNGWRVDQISALY